MVMGLPRRELTANRTFDIGRSLAQLTRVVDSGPPISRVRKDLQQHGLLPFTDWEAPSLVSMVAGGPVSGSWWGDPAGQLIYEVGEALYSDPDVLVVRLWLGKLTLVHRCLWPPLLRIGKARAAWQIDGLSEVASQLLARVEREKIVRSDHLPVDFPWGTQGFRTGLRSLDRRLLVLTRSVHTRTGAHALEAESWKAWGARTRSPPFPKSVASAQLVIEHAARRLTPGVEPHLSLPWGRP